LKLSDWHRHPTLLAGMIMYPRHLSFVPTDRHHFEPGIFIDQITGVEVRIPEKVAADRIDVYRIFAQIEVNIVAGKLIFGDGPEAID
jgi:hypothetical protein